MKKIYLSLLLYATLLTGCLDQISYETENYQYKLIVDGSVSNAPGPYRLKLFTSKQYTDPDNTEPFSADKVTLTEVGGKSINYAQKDGGVYETDSASFRCEIGKSYYIKIVTIDGKIYQSRPETILQPVPIDTYKIDFSKDVLNPRPFNLSIVTKDPIIKSNLYQWKWAHYDSTTACVKAKTWRGVVVNLCCNKEKCWNYAPCLDCIYTGSDALTNGKTIITPVGAFPYDSRKPYFIVLQQFSISPQYFQFLKIANTQIYNSGGIFDNPPAKVPGNITNINDLTEDVLGYFSASGLTQKAVFIERDRKEYPRLTPPPKCDWNLVLPECRTCDGPLRTNRQPFGWKE